MELDPKTIFMVFKPQNHWVFVHCEANFGRDRRLV